jgi:hypothetical protein
MTSTKAKKSPTKKSGKSKSPSKGRRSSSASVLSGDDSQSDDSDLPKDETGRRKIKRQYETLLGIRIEKLKGRILNRERINKTIEGVYFICVKCKKVCHNMDDGLVEDPNNVENTCGNCAKPKKDNKRKQAAA